MKNMKRIATIALALVMVFTMAISASAALTEITEKGSIIIKDNDSVKASEKTFEAYKILDLKAYTNDEGQVVNYEYTVPADMADFYADYFGLDKTSENFSAVVLAHIASVTDLYDFAGAALAAATSDPYEGEAVSNGYKFSDLPLGYYVIADTTAEGDYAKPVSALILDTATPDIEIEVKAERPPIEKKIDDDNDLTTTDDRVETNDAAIGDTITYVITSKVPEMTGYNEYYFIAKDHMSKGLTYTNNMVVKVGDKLLTKDTDYALTVTENEDGTTDLKIVFKDFIQYNTAEYIGKPVTITYTAVLNEDAEIYEAPNVNDVYLLYSSDPNFEYEPGDEPPVPPNDPSYPPVGETPKEEVRTYTTTLELIKTDPIGDRLSGAEFTLTGESLNTVRVETETFTLDENGTYWLLKDGSYTTTDPNGTINNAPVDKDKYASLTDKYSKQTNVEFVEKSNGTVTVTATVGQDGVLRFEGIPSGDFVIKEIKAPEGYNMLKEEIEVTVSFDAATETFSYEGAVDADGRGQITVINQAGSELPSTGGIGTTMFYVIGGVMAVAALILLVAKKRMSNGN